MNFATNSIYDLGTGVYTIPDISAILHLPQQKVRRWMNEYWTDQFGNNTKIKFLNSVGQEQVANFYTLIEFFTFYQLREYGVSSQKVVNAHEVLSNFYKTQYPFATSNILTDGKNVLFNGEVGDIIKADKTLQIVIKEVFEPFCKRIEFGNNDLAERFFPLGKKHEIVIDPHHQFGQPTIEKTNILTDTVYQLFRGGESLSVIANLFELSNKQVQDAIAFHRQDTTLYRNAA